MTRRMYKTLVKKMSLLVFLGDVLSRNIYLSYHAITSTNAWNVQPERLRDEWGAGKGTRQSLARSRKRNKTVFREVKEKEQDSL